MKNTFSKILTILVFTVGTCSSQVYAQQQPPAPQPPALIPIANLEGPVTGKVGKLVKVSAGKSQGLSILWRAINIDNDDYVLVNDEREVVFVSQKAGICGFEIIVSSISAPNKIIHAKTTYFINIEGYAPQPPTSPTPPTGTPPITLPEGNFEGLPAKVRTWALEIPDSKVAAGKLAEAYLEVAKGTKVMTFNGSPVDTLLYTDIEGMLKLQTARNREILGADIEKWRPFFVQRLAPYLDEQTIKGRLKDLEDYKNMAKEVSMGLNAAKESK